jgi:outer membrane receptor for ferrienterochelin and colicins
MMLLTFASAVAAQEHDVDAIVVTGARSERRLADTPVATEVITRQELEESGADSVADVLEDYSGVQIERSFAGAGVSMQGLAPQYVLVLVDGERVMGRTNGIVDLSRLRVEDIERIEIVRGPSSALYGSDAIGGVINVITRRAGEDEIELEASAAYGTLNQVDGSALGAVHLGDWSARLSAGYHRRDAFDLDENDQSTDGGRFDEVHVAGNGGYDVEGVELELRAEYLYRDSASIDSTAAGAVFDRSSRTETLTMGASSEFEIDGPEIKLGTDLYYSLFRDQFLSDQRGSNALDQFQETVEHLVQASVILEAIAGESHLLTIGGDAIYESLASERLEGGSGDRWRGALYAEDEWTMVEEPLASVVPGIRVDADSQFGWHVTPKVALRVDPIEEIALRISYGVGYRAPGFRELLVIFENPGAGYLIEGNPDLRPETSIGVNAGFEAKPIRWLRFGVNFFRNDIDDLIDTMLAVDASGGEPDRYTYTNIATAHTQGIEATIAIRLLRTLRLELGYTLTDTEDETLRRPLEGRAAHRGTFALRYRSKRFGLEATARGSLVGDRPFYLDNDGDGELERIDADPYFTLGLRVAKDLGEHLTLFVEGENLFDAGDADFLQIEPLSISGGLTVRY